MKYSVDIVVFDLEATCLTKGNNEISETNIIEIGAVRLDRRTLEIVSEFDELVNPRDIPIPPFITDMTGITPEMVKGKDTFDKVGKRFVEWYGPRNRAILAAFGAYYDLPLLRKECQAFGINFNEHFGGSAFDIRGVAIAYLAEKNRSISAISLSDVLRKLEIDFPFTEHRAINDAKATAAILQHFHLGRVLL